MDANSFGENVMRQEEQSGFQVRAELVKVRREFMKTRTKLKNLEKRHKLLMKLDREYNTPPKNSNVAHDSVE